LAKKPDSVKHTLVLRGRYVESTVFDHSVSRKADLEGARLQGASLKDAELHGASLMGAELLGASLMGAKLQGASLRGAALQAASLDRAQVQGANFQKSTLTGTNMGGVAVWRTSFDASLTAVFKDDAKLSPISNDDFAALNASFMKEVPEGERREQALKRIEILNPDIFGPEASEQKFLGMQREDETTYQQSLADQLKSLACSGDEDARYILLSLVTNGRIKATGGRAQGLVDAIISPMPGKDCPVSSDLTGADKALLREAVPKGKTNEASGSP